jgi:predicted PurR-regulated permease PerM
MVWSLVMENVVKTRLIGRGTRMHDLLVFLSVLGGLVAFGILGLLYGPLLVAAFLTLTDLYREHYRMELALKIVEKTEE